MESVRVREKICFLYTSGLYTPKVVHFIKEEVFVVKIVSHRAHRIQVESTEQEPVPF